MDSDEAAALHKRLVELMRASGSHTLRVSQVAAILGVDGDEEQKQLRVQLSRSRIVQYDPAQQTIRSLLPKAREDEDEAALLALSDADVVTGHRSRQRRSSSRHTTRVSGGYRSDTAAYGAAAAAGSINRSFTGGMSRRRIAGAWNKPGQRGLEDAVSYLGPVGRVGYVCVADELHLGKLEAYYRVQGYYTKFDFDVLHVRFAQPPTTATTASGAHAEAETSGLRERERVRRAGQHTAAPAAAGGGNGGTGADEYLHDSPSDTSRSPPPPLARQRTGPVGDGVAAGAASSSPRGGGYGSTGSTRVSADGGEAAAGAGAAATSSSNGSASVKQGFDLFIFPYGAVVWWGFDQRYFKIVENDYMLPHSAISHCMTNRYTTQLVNENYPVWCTYNLVRRDTLEVDDDFKARLRFDHFVIPYSRGEVATGSVLMLCASHALAQSAKIDYIELQVQELADSCSPLPRELREKGSVSITERRLLQLRGEVLSYRLMLKSGSDLLDEPDFFWENAYLKPVFQATKEEFEIAERVEALDNKLDAANEILSMLAEDFSQRHGARLEWIVIWLVFVEVVIGVLELLVDIRPWMSYK